MHADLEQLQSEFEAIRADAGRLVKGITPEQFNWRAGAGKWSIGECLMHLNVVNGLDVESLAKAVTEARANGLLSEGPFSYGRVASWFIRRMEPPVTMRTRAPKVYQPPPPGTPAEVIREFYRIHGRLLDILRMADGIDLARVKVPTPVSKWIRFSFTQRMRLIAAHDRRHLWQAWQVPMNTGFPS